jgi:hypothetical protein
LFLKGQKKATVISKGSENDRKYDEEIEEESTQRLLPKIDLYERGLITFVDPYMKLADLLDDDEVINSLLKRAQEFNPRKT